MVDAMRCRSPWVALAAMLLLAQASSTPAQRSLLQAEAAPGPAGTAPAVGINPTTTAPGPAAASDPLVSPTTTAAPGPAPLPEPTASDLRAADGYVYDFRVTDIDYIAPFGPLPYNNLTALPPAPPEVLARIPPQTDNLVTWNLAILQANRALWARRANRKIEDAVTTVQEAADIALKEPIYDPTNKTILAPTQNNQPRDAREYVSLSDYYWPYRKSAVNPDGLPYRYEPSVNLEVYDFTPNKQHLELTIEHVTSLTLAWYFSGNVRYAQRARDKIYVWFLDPARSMLPSLRAAGIIRGVTTSGRPQGIFDMARIADVLNAAALLEGSGVWSAADRAGLQAWMLAYATWLETEPVALYTLKMANYVSSNYLEQLLAINLYLGRLPEAARIAAYAPLKKNDQIVDGVLRYEKDRDRSLDFSQECLLSWVNIARMAEKLGMDLWSDGLVAGQSVKDAFDLMRPYLETLGTTWPFRQVGTPRVRIAATLAPRFYVAFAVPGVPDSGPQEYIKLYEVMYPTFSTAGAKARAVIDRLPNIELDSQYAEYGIPLIEECNSLSCDSRTLAIWSITAFAILLVVACLLYNRWIHWRAARATEVPRYLRKIREQQAKYKQMNLKVTPAKPDYVLSLKAEAERLRLKAAAQEAEDVQDKELKKEIKRVEDKLARARESRIASQMQSQMYPPYGAPYSGLMMPAEPSGYSASQASGAGGSSFYEHQTSFMAGGGGSHGMGGARGYLAPDGAGAFAAGAPVSGYGRHRAVHQHIPPVPEAEEFSFPTTPTNGVEGVGASASHLQSLTPTGSIGTAPSQSLTGIIAGAHALIGEIGQSSTIAQSPLAAHSGVASTMPRASPPPSPPPSPPQPQRNM